MIWLCIITFPKQLTLKSPATFSSRDRENQKPVVTLSHCFLALYGIYMFIYLNFERFIGYLVWLAPKVNLALVSRHAIENHFYSWSKAHSWPIVRHFSGLFLLLILDFIYIDSLISIKSTSWYYLRSSNETSSLVIQSRCPR